MPLLSIDDLHVALGGRSVLEGIDLHLDRGEIVTLLARALLEKPDLLLLDEATQGLDHRGTADFYRQIETVRRELGCAVLMVSHELHVVMRTADRVVCLNRHICCQGTPERVLASPAYQALFGPETNDALAFYRHDHGRPAGTATPPTADTGNLETAP